METGYITIMDFPAGETHIYPIIHKPGFYPEDFIESLGFDINLVEWMTTDTIKLQIH